MDQRSVVPCRFMMERMVGSERCPFPRHLPVKICFVEWSGESVHLVTARVSKVAALDSMFVTWGNRGKKQSMSLMRRKEDVFVARTSDECTDVQVELHGCSDARYEVNVEYWQVPGHHLRSFGHTFAREAKLALLVLKRMKVDKNVANLIVMQLAKLHADAGMKTECEICKKEDL
jgi:hypothetical protein